MLEWFLKNHVPLKTRVKMLKIGEHLRHPQIKNAVLKNNNIININM